MGSRTACQKQLDHRLKFTTCSRVPTAVDRRLEQHCSPSSHTDRLKTTTRRKLSPSQRPSSWTALTAAAFGHEGSGKLPDIRHCTCKPDFGSTFAADPTPNRNHLHLGEGQKRPATQEVRMRYEKCCLATVTRHDRGGINEKVNFGIRVATMNSASVLRRVDIEKIGVPRHKNPLYRSINLFGFYCRGKFYLCKLMQVFIFIKRGAIAN